MTAKLHYWQALNRALDEAMASDESVFVMGEDVGLFGGTYKVTQGLYARYGEWRVAIRRFRRTVLLVLVLAQQ